MENILIYLTRKHQFFWDEIYKAISNHEPVVKEEVKKLSALDTNKTTLISDFYPTYLMKAFKPPFVLFHLGNYDLISNKMIGIVGKIDESKIKVLKFLASNQYVMNFKLSSMEDNDLELLQKNKIPCIIFCDDIMMVKQGSQYQKYLKEDNFLFLSETYMNSKNTSFLEYYINRIFVGHDLPIIIFDKSVNDDLGLITYLNITKHKVYLYEQQHTKPEYDKHIGAVRINNFNDLKVVFINKN